MNLDIVPNWIRIQYPLDFEHRLLFAAVAANMAYEAVHGPVALLRPLQLDEFSLGLYYPSDQHSRGRKVSALLLYVVHLLISVVPIVADVIDYYLISAGADAAYRNFGLDIFGGYHYGFIHPAITLVGIYAWFPQNDELRCQTQLHSLSQTGLAAQAVIFAFVVISWTMRTNLYDSNLPNLPFWATIPEWFIYVWVRHREQSSTDQETQPLLSERASQSEE
ncbi:hypothetical protein AAWM_06218 [Aspergillus awamori]|uniref:Uncharacterized protein n=1 Tax=Aspergillus awamori TaxID=105351 RepID=A0A401KVJ7_ASPAW|nr:hypothetical protein AAWM_06218 [Aspergillus awamori]